MSVNPEDLAKNNSTRAFVTALVTNVILLGVEVGVFIGLKRRLGRIYSPRTYLPPPDKRADELPKGAWKWVPALLTSPLDDVVHKNGLDAYMFLRFLKLLLNIFLVFTFLTFVVIMPVDAVGIKSEAAGLDLITWTNITLAADTVRFSAHTVLAYVLTFYVLWLVRREMLHFLHMRHQFLLSPEHSKLAQARTVLITSVPDELGDEHEIRQFGSFVPGGVDRVWLLRDTKALNELHEARQELCEDLEKACSTVLVEATKAWKAKQKAEAKALKARKKNGIKDEENPNGAEDQQKLIPVPTNELLTELVPMNKRPSHRTGFLGIFGTKVDSITWYKEEIARLNAQIKEAREHTAKGKFLGSAFIRCNLQMGAHVLAQCVSYHEPWTMYEKWMEVNPRDIVWANLDDGAAEMSARKVLSWAATFGLIFIWSFPSAFIGTLSNLDDLCERARWLRWICTAPDPVPGLIQGVLPPLLLAILFALLPFILKGLAWYECIPRYSLISVSVYHRFFLFLLIHGFLIVTATSGITGAIEDIIKNPTSTVQTLASQLPKAYIFFLTYMVTQGLAGAGAALIQLAPLVIHYIKKWLLGRTPRQAYSVTFIMPAADFGLILPRISLLAIIATAYSIISPLINLLAVITFACYFIAFKFLITQVFDQPNESETAGMYFPLAIANLFVGLYISQVCMAALIFLKVSTAEGRTASLVLGILMVVLVAITIYAHVTLKSTFEPIIKHLPMSLATQKMAKKMEKEKKKRSLKLGTQSDDDDSDLDLFNVKRIKSLRKRIKHIPKELEGFKNKMGSPRPSKASKDTAEPEAVATGVHPSASTKVKDFAAPASSEVKEKQGQIEEKGIEEMHRPDSRASNKSEASIKYKGPKKEKVNGSRRIRIDAPAPAETNVSDDDTDGEADADDYDEHAFDHPSTHVNQPWIWIPKDTLGLSEVFVKDLKAGGVDASDIGATMDDGGVVEVTRNPPDQEWLGGHDT